MRLFSLFDKFSQFDKIDFTEILGNHKGMEVLLLLLFLQR